jgi:Ca2+-binding EF-hand superfamily protein
MGQKQINPYKTILNETQLDFLHKISGFSKYKLEKLHNAFINDCPNGFLTRKQFYKFYRLFYPYGNPVKFSNRVFKIFDKNNDNQIDFYEFVDAIRRTMGGKLENKLECAFRIYDLNGDNFIDRKELKIIVKSIYELIGEDVNSCDKMVNYIMSQFDTNCDNKIDLNEFIDGCKKSKDLCNLLSPMNHIST